MSINTDELKVRAEIDSLLSHVSDDFPVDVAHAALYLGVGLSTLANWRSNGEPPPYIQFKPGKGSKVQYRMGVLRTFVREREYSNTAEAQTQKIYGRRPTSAFMRAVGESGFWVSQNSGAIIDSVFGDALDFGVAFVSDDEYGVQFASWKDALLLQWCDKSRQMEYVLNYSFNYPKEGSEIISSLMSRGASRA